MESRIALSVVHTLAAAFALLDAVRRRIRIASRAETDRLHNRLTTLAAYLDTYGDAREFTKAMIVQDIRAGVLDGYRPRIPTRIDASYPRQASDE